MKNLNLLVKILTKRVKKKNFSFLENGYLTPKEKQLFDIIKSGNIHDENETSKIIYGRLGEEPSFFMLKHRLRNKLLDQFFFIDNSSGNIKHANKMKIEYLRTFHLGNVLKLEGERKMALKLIFRSFKIAEKAEFTSFALNSLEVLLGWFSDMGQIKLVKKFQAHYDRLNYIKMKEDMANKKVNELSAYLRTSTLASQKRLYDVEDVTNYLYELYDETPTINIYEKYYMLKMWYLELVGSYEDIIKVALDSENKYEAGKLNRFRFDHRLNKFLLVSSFLKTRQYTEGIKHALKYLEYFYDSSTNRFVFLENLFLLYMHSKQYTLAKGLIEKVFINQFFEKLNAKAQERWHLYNAYLNLVLPDVQVDQIKIYKFLGLVPEYQKDKAGFNMAILIYQIFYHSNKGNYDFLFQRMEPLQIYFKRYFKEEFSMRTKLFVRMLQYAVKKSLNIKEFGRYSNTIFQQLKELPFSGEAFSEREIIPYEHLWELFIETLEKNIQKSMQRKNLKSY